MGWPHKIEMQMEATLQILDDDEERFHRLQLQDQANFNDRLDTLSVSLHACVCTCMRAYVCVCECVFVYECVSVCLCMSV